MEGARSFEAGPAQLVLTASVARRYYVDGCSKVEIAEEFSLSRFKVARLLEQARTSGLVRIEIGYAGDIDVELSERLRELLGLRHAIVVATPEEDEAALRKDLGKAAADLLAEIVTTDDVLGLAWARAVTAMTESLRTLPAVSVVQLTGALSRPDVGANSIELVRETARRFGGVAYFFYAPLIVPDAATAAVLRGQLEVARAFGQFRNVTKAVVGLGAWDAGLSTLYDAMGDDERAHLRDLGVVADLSGVFVDALGRPVQSGLTDRMIGIGAEQLQTIPDVLAIPYGVAKAGAVRAAVRSGMVNAIVTHSALAHALLADPSDR